MDQQRPPASVDETLVTSVERVRSSRQLLDQIEERLARGAELLDPTPPVIDLRDGPDRDSDVAHDQNQDQDQSQD